MKALISILFTLSAAVSTLFAADDPRQLPPTYADVSYGPYEKNTLDFWQAKGDGPRPLLVYIYILNFSSVETEQNVFDIRDFRISIGALQPDRTS